MTYTIVVANQKGGATKTTTSVHIATRLIKLGKKVLFVDCDPQCNSTDTYNGKIEGHITLYDLIFDGEDSTEKAIQDTSLGKIIPSDPLLNEAEDFLNKKGKQKLFILKKILKPLQSDYDFIIIDTPPNLGALLINALNASDYVIVPFTGDRYHLQGLKSLNDTIEMVKQVTNPDLKVLGLVISRFMGRTNNAKIASNNLSLYASAINTTPFNTVIRESTKIRDSQNARMTIYDYDANNNVAKDYISLVDEVLERINKNGKK